MRTTDSIIADLQKRRTQALEDGSPVGGTNIDQQIIAHQSLARIRAERAATKDLFVRATLDAQIAHWLTFVDEDVDERIAEQPKKDSTKTVEGLDK